MKQRPVGVAIFAGLFLLGAAAAIVVACIPPLHPWAIVRYLLEAWLLGMIGFGLWNLRNWARTSLIVLLSFGLISEIFRKFVAGRPISEPIVAIVLYGLLFWYLSRPGVRQAFHGEDAWPKVVHAAVLAIFVVLLAFPFFWMAVATFKQNLDLYTTDNNPFLFNMPPTLEHLRYLFGQTDYLLWLGNTALVGAAVVAITLVLAIPAAYALTRLTGNWGERLGIAIFLTYLVPPTLLFIPMSRVVAILGLQDTLWSLVLVYPTTTIPFSIWLLMGFFKSIPKELEDAAMVDGLTRFGAFVKLVIPISLSGILTVVIFTFTLVTQEFVYAVTFISPKSKQMVGVGVPNFLVLGDVYYWGALMAACLIASLPIAFLYNLFLDRFIAGFTVGAVKG
jgi:multiple sugar transport system permease protein